MYTNYGHWRSTARGQRLQLHRNAGLELVYVSSGTMDWEVDGKPERITPGTFFFTLPWQLHGSHHEAPVGADLRWLVIPATTDEQDEWTFDQSLGLPFSTAEYGRIRRAFASERHAFCLSPSKKSGHKTMTNSIKDVLDEGMCGTRTTTGHQFESLLSMAISAIEAQDRFGTRAMVYALVSQAVTIIEGTVNEGDRRDENHPSKASWSASG